MSIESRSRQYGRVFDHWRIREFLGSGSGGKTAVFRLVHFESESVESALKVVNLIEEQGSPDRLSESRRQDYLRIRSACKEDAQREVLLMNRLQGHSNVVGYLDHTFVDWQDETGFGCDMLIRMELLQDLRSQIREDRRFSEEEILKVGTDICNALVLCHGKNILHRDIKPGNILFNRDGNYKLGDFGISRLIGTSPASAASTGIGTPQYLAPEQTSGNYDKRVDIYSLGLVLYELSNGNRMPFAASAYVTAEDISRRLSGEPLPTPVNASPALARVIRKACAFLPEDRYQSPGEFLEALKGVSAAPAQAACARDPYETFSAEDLSGEEEESQDEPFLLSLEDWEDMTASNASPVYHRQTPAKRTRKKKRKDPFPVIIGTLAVCLVITVALLIGALSDGTDQEEHLSASTESTPVQTKGAETLPAATELSAAETTEEPAEAPTEAPTQPEELYTVYLRISNQDETNNLFYEYNDDGTLYRFANRNRDSYTTTYYIYDDGSLIDQIEAYHADGAPATVRADLLFRMKTLLGNPTETDIQYRIVALDPEGRPVRQMFVDQELLIERNEYYFYDSRGNLIRLEREFFHADISDDIVEYTYDNEDRLLEIKYIYPDSTTLRKHYYDSEGLLSQQVEFLALRSGDYQETGTSWEYFYDQQGREIKRIYNLESSPNFTYAYSYDENGNVIHMERRGQDVSLNSIDSYSYISLQIPASRLDALRLIYDNVITFLPLNVVEE